MVLGHDTQRTVLARLGRIGSRFWRADKAALDDSRADGRHRVAGQWC
jgi:hypothetical protein